MQFPNFFQKTRGIKFVLLVLTLSVAACAPVLKASPNLDVRPLEDVYVASAPQIGALTASDGELIFDSSLPLACSVIYGSTTDYGLIAVDQDMGGGAHTDHRPLLTGLESNTVYHYRVQGTASDGTLYVSKDMTFRTPSQEANTEINLASLKEGAQILSVSSNYGGVADDETWGANSAIDNNRGTAWSSDGNGNDAYIEIQLAEPAHINTVEVWTRSMSDGTAQIFSFTLTTGSGDVLGPFTLDNAEESYRFKVAVIASSLRLDVVDSSGGNTGLIEFAAYGTP